MKGFIEVTKDGTTMLIALHNIAAITKRGELALITLDTVVGDFDPISHSGVVEETYGSLKIRISNAQ